MNTFEKIKKDIKYECELNSMHEIPDWMVNDILEYIVWNPKWRTIDGKPAYLIGISEDHWDYYYVYLIYDNGMLDLRYMTCCYHIGDEYKDLLYSPFSYDELLYLKYVIKQQIIESTSDKLIYM